MRRYGAKVPLETVRFDRAACAGNYRSSNKLTSRLRVDSSCKTPIGEEPHDAARGTVGSFSASMQKNHRGLLKASPRAQRKNWGHPLRLPSVL